MLLAREDAIQTPGTTNHEQPRGRFTAACAAARRPEALRRPCAPPAFPCPIDLERFGGLRKTELLSARGAKVVIWDDWRAERPVRLGYGFWTGSTTFTLLSGPDDLGGELLLGPDEGGDDFYSPYDDLDEGGGEGVRRPTIGQRVSLGPCPSGTRGGGGDAYNPPNAAARHAAEEYTKAVTEEFGNHPKAWAALVKSGTELLRAAGSVAEAAKSLWAVREDLGLMNLKRIDDPLFDHVLHPDHLCYLRDVRTYGMAARYDGPRRRVRAGLHPNAKRHLDQVFTQIAKDVKKHRVLVVDAEAEELHSTIASPFEAVDKMLPDRTISADKRVVHDQRGVNAGTSSTCIHRRCSPCTPKSHAGSYGRRRRAWGCLS